MLGNVFRIYVTSSLLASARERAMEQNNSAPRHTPGPWYAKQGCIYSRAHEVEYATNPKDAPYIWRVVPTINGKTAEEIEGNEALIGAAPQLLTELTSLVARFRTALIANGTDPEYADAAIQSALNVISKAEGRQS